MFVSTAGGKTKYTRQYQKQSYQLFHAITLFVKFSFLELFSFFLVAIVCGIG